MPSNQNKKSPSDYPLASVRLSESHQSDIRRMPDESWSSATRRHLDYVATGREHARRELAGKFTPHELLSIVTALQGTFLEPSILPYLHSEVFEFLDEDVIGETVWGIDAELMRQRLMALSFMARWALADMVTAWREAPEKPQTAAEWAALGVVPDGR